VARDRDASGAGAPVGTVARAARRTGRVGPWLALPALVWFAWWVAPEVHLWGTLMGTLATGFWLHRWSSAATPALALRRDALVARREALDEHYPWPRVLDVAADEAALVIRTSASVVEGADALMYAPPPGGELLPGVTDPRTARERILAARDAALGHARADTRTRRRPAPAAVVAAATALGVLTAFLLGGTGAG
jgi:hypothetical protein